MKPPPQYVEKHVGKRGFVPNFGSPSNVSLKKKPTVVVKDTMELRWKDGQLVVQSHPAARNHPAPAYQGAPDISMVHQLEGAQGGGQALNYVPEMMQENDLSPWLGYYEPFHFGNPWNPEDGMPLEPVNEVEDSVVLDPIPDAAAAAVALMLPGSSQGTPSLEPVIYQTVAPAPQPEPPYDAGKRLEGKQAPSAKRRHKSTGAPEPEQPDVKTKEARPSRRGRGSKQRRGEQSTGTTRSRSAENHNLAEKKRREKINERMRILKELIPSSSRTDKASTLDGAIKYLNSLQQTLHFLQLMSSGKFPMALPYMSMADQMLMYQNMVGSTSVPPAAEAASTAFPHVQSQLMSHLPPPGFIPSNYNFPMMMPGQQGTQIPMLQMPLFPYMTYFGQHYPHTQQKDNPQ